MDRLHPFLALRPGESSTSFCSRLAALHRMPSVRTFFRYLGLRFTRIVAGDPAMLDQLAALTSVPFETLTRQSLRRENGAFHYRGQVALQPMMRRSRVHVCPRCLVEDIKNTGLPANAACYGRVAWQFGPIRACPRHNVLLEQFGLPLHPSTAYDFARAIEPFLGSLGRRAAEAEEVQPSAAESYLWARLEGKHTPSALLDQMPWYAAVRTCEVLGSVALFGASARVAKLEERDRRRAADVGFAIVDGGERSLEASLDDLVRRHIPTGTGRDGAPTIYGALSDLLTRPTPDPAYDPMREIVFQHATAAIPCGPGESVVGRPVKRRRVHSLVTAADQVGQHPTRLRKLLVAEGLIPADAPEAHRDVLFDARRAAPFLRRIAKGLKLHDVTEHLQTRYAHTLTIVRHGFIKPIVEAAACGETARATYAAADLEDFIASLVENAVVCPQPERPIMDIPKAAKRAYCTTPDVLRMILRRELAWVGLDPDVSGFHAILVNAEEVLDRVRGSDHEGYTIQTLRIRLGVHQRVVEGLLAGGHLPRVATINPVNRCPNLIVPPDAVDAFQHAYVSLSELARRWEVNAFKLKKDLDRRGIRPALRNDQVGATFYQRSALL